MSDSTSPIPPGEASADDDATLMGGQTPSRPDTGKAGEPDAKGRAKPDRYLQQDVLNEGMPPEYKTETDKE